jgi:hypothetical protein
MILGEQTVFLTMNCKKDCFGIVYLGAPGLVAEFTIQAWDHHAVDICTKCVVIFNEMHAHLLDRDRIRVKMLYISYKSSFLLCLSSEVV